MATKSFMRSHSQTQSHHNNHYQQKVNLFDKVCSPSRTSLHQTENCLFNNNKFSFNSSIIDSAQRRLASVCQILPFFIPVTTSSSIISDCYSESHKLDRSPLTSCVDSPENMEISMPSRLSSCPILASTDGTDIGMSEKLLRCQERGVPPPSQQHSVMGKGDYILSSSVNTSNILSASNKNLHDRCSDSEKMEPVVSSCLRGRKVQQDCSHGNVSVDGDNTEKSEEASAQYLPSCDCLVPNKRKQKDCANNASSAVNKNAKFGTSVDGCTLGLALKPINNPALVLSAPRKIVRKGRPSSKKQRKRNREKGKRETSLLQTKEIVSLSTVNNKIKQGHSDSQSFEFAVGLSQELNNTTHDSSRILLSKFKNNLDKPSAPVNATSRFCLLFRRKSSSEEVDDDDGDDDDEWPTNEHNAVCISPIDSFGFNFALTLDSIFKKADSPKCLVNAKTNGSAASCTKNNPDLGESLFRMDSYDDSDVEMCAYSESAGFFDNDCATSDLFETAADFTDNGNLSADSINSQTCGQVTDFEKLKRVNAQWNEYYPTSGVLSCKPKDDIERQAAIKVHFAAEPELLTVHIVEEEDRSSKWILCALDRGRFETRILELEKIISPVLDADHRIKIREHRL